MLPFARLEQKFSLQRTVLPVVVLTMLTRRNDFLTCLLTISGRGQLRATSPLRKAARLFFLEYTKQDHVLRLFLTLE